MPGERGQREDGQLVAKHVANDTTGAPDVQARSVSVRRVSFAGVECETKDARDEPAR